MPILSPEDREALALVSPADFAFLSLTNPARLPNEQGDESPIILTEKSAYSWAAILAWYVIEREATENHIVRRLDIALKRLRERETSTKPWSFDRRTSSIQRVRKAFFAGGTPNPYAPELYKLERMIDNSLARLEQAELIIDPFVEPIFGVPFILLGVIPYSFSRRTDIGDSYHLRIRALLWDFEQLRDGDKKEIHLYFRISKVIDHLKQKLPLLWTDTEPSPALSASKQPSQRARKSK